MTPIAELVLRLGAAGCSIEQIALAVELQERHIIAREERRSEQNSARQRRWRDKRRNVTSQDVTSVTQEPSEKVHIDTSLTSSSLTDSKKAQEEIVARRPAQRGARIPSDWSPSEADFAFAVGLIGSPRTSAEIPKFKDYWQARAGPGGRKNDWSATWRNWIRKTAENGKTNGNLGVGAEIRGSSGGDRARELAAIARQRELEAGIGRPPDPLGGS